MAAKTFLKTTMTTFLLFLLTSASATVHAKIIYVDDDGPAEFSNIQAAIDDSNDGDIIIVNPGTYNGDGNRDIDFKGKAITVRSTDPNNPNIVAATIIDCEGSDEDYHRGFYFRSGEDENSILEGLTITNGLHSTGAGICCLGSSPTIRNNIITGNETGFGEDGGAGIGCWYGASPIITNNIISDNICAPGGGGGGIRCFDWCSPAITNCTFSRNSPGGMKINNSNPTISNCTFEGNLGGGVSSSSFSSSIFINCTFIGNSSPTGGGMRVYESNPTLINCSFIQNVAATRGGGIWIYGWDTASPTLINCTFAGNSAANYGGGMYNRDSTRPTLVNCTFTGNSADDAGGAVYNDGYDWSVRITLNNCTFSGNSAANGNDLACDSPYGPPSNVEMTNCILWDGENPIWNNDGSTITINYSDVHGDWPGEGNIDADPCFVDPDGIDDIPGTEDDNLRLLPDSPCVDAGDPNYVTEPNETDLDGKPRVIGGRIDMGAYEFLSQMILYVDTDATGANDGSSWADAYNYLQDALDVAYSGDEIRVAQGTYKPDQGAGITPGDQTTTFQLINSVTLKGGYAGYGEPDPNVRDIEIYETILTGDLNDDDIQVDDPLDLEYRYDNSRHVVTGSGTDETTVLDGFTVTRGQGIGIIPGGGMYNGKGNPTIIKCTFSWNGAAGSSDCAGGGMFNNQSSPTLIGCTFSHNAASWPGGGGISNLLSSPTLINCVFLGNKSGGPDGGEAGAMDNWEDSSPTLINCVFIGNYAEGVAGAIYSGGNYVDTVSNPTLINCTFVGNSAGYRGGAIIQESGTLTLTNCIMWDNTAPEGNVMYLQHGYQVDATVNISYSGIEGGQSGFYIEQGCTLNWGVGNIDADPCFVDLGYWDANGVWVDGDYHLLPDSPCINTGDPNYIAEPNETDLDGNPRVIGGRIDMGAYEYSPAIPAEARVIPRTINLASKGNWITCYIWLPGQYNVADIDPNSILLEDSVPAALLSVNEQQQVATAKFICKEVQTILEVGDIELTITGQLNDGTVFEGTNTIKVVDKADKK